MARTRKNQNVTVNTAEAQAVNTTEEVKAVVTAPMRNALIKAWETGNVHAITNTEAAYADVQPADFNQWVYWVRELRDVAIKYGEVAANKDASDEDLALARGRVFAKWRHILKCGEKDLFHKNMFCREHDADTLRVYATGITWVSVDGLGSAFAYTAPDKFRRMVELFIGCRMAANAILCDADRDILTGFQAAVKAEKTAEERLEGNDKNPGLKKQLETQKNELENAEALLRDVVGDAADTIIQKNPSFIKLRAAIRETQAAIDTCKKQIADAKEYQATNRKLYQAVISTLNRIEAPALK